MSKTHPVVFSFGGSEHHLTVREAQQARGRLDAAILAATMQQDRNTRETCAKLEEAKDAPPPVDRSARTTLHGTPLGQETEIEPTTGMQKDYVVLTAEERRKGFVRPVRRSYKHVGTAAKSGCGTVTSMGLALSETYARDPSFYSGTFCCGCRVHLPVGADGEFVWTDDGERVGT